MALANETRTYSYYCDKCKSHWYSRYVDEQIYECPVHGPTKLHNLQRRNLQHEIDTLNRKLQEGIYE